MQFEDLMNVVILTTYSITALVVVLILFRAEDESIGSKRNWFLLAILCGILGLRTGVDLLDEVWIRALQRLLGIGAAVFLPWTLWKIYLNQRANSLSGPKE